MANEIVKLVAKKAKISESVAQVAVDTVFNLLKDKLPPALGSTLDSFLGSGTATKSIRPASKSSKTVSKSAKKSDSPLDELSSIANALGGLFGKK